MLAILGPALFWAWDYACFATTLAYGATGFGGAGRVADVVFLVAQVSVLLATVALRRFGAPGKDGTGREPAVPSRWLIGLSAGVLAAFTVLRGALDANDPVQAAVLVVAVVAGGAVPPVAVAWGARQTLEHARMPLIVGGSFLVAYLLFLLAMLLPGDAAWAVAAVFPVVSAVLWAWDGSLRGVGCDSESRRERMAHEMADGETRLRLLPWPTLLAFAIASFLGEFTALVVDVRVPTGASSLVAGTIANVAFCVVVCVLAKRDGTSLSVGDSFFFLAPLIVGVLLLQLIGGASASETSQLLHSATVMLQVVLWMLLAQETERDGLSPLSTFGIGLFVLSSTTCLAHGLGRAALGLTADVPQAAGWTAGAAILVLTCTLSVLAFERGRVRGSDAPSAGSGASDRAGAFDDACEAWEEAVRRKLGAFASQKGLSPRETEVFAHLLVGETAQRIGEELGLTTGTVKTHVSHIYRKLGVNTRQQAVDAFEGYQAAER